jgi:type IV pilus assembly protein PilN
MRIPINLASQPLENLRPLRTAVVLAVLAAVVLGVVIVQRGLRSRSEFRSLIEQQAKLEESLQNLHGQQQEMESWLTTPEAAQIRERSGFLNSLILRKGLSWTQLFVDLEKTLPSNARIVTIKPTLSPSEDVDLTLTVAASSMGPLVDFLKKLEASPQFGAPAVNGQHYSSEKTSSGDISLEVTARYRQEHLASGTAETAAAEATATLRFDPASYGSQVSAAEPANKDTAKIAGDKIAGGEETR